MVKLSEVEIQEIRDAQNVGLNDAYLNAGGVYYTGGEGWRGFHNEYNNDKPYIECPLHGSGAWIDEGFDGSDAEFDNAGDGFIDNWIDGDG